MKKHTHTDNIHLTPEGYKKIADSIITSAQNMTSKSVSLPTCTTTATKGIEQVYWHGFTITSGYGNKSRATPNSAHRGRGGRHHPYRRLVVRSETSHVLLAAAASSQAVLVRASKLPAVPTAHTAHTGPTSSPPHPLSPPQLSPQQPRNQKLKSSVPFLVFFEELHLTNLLLFQ